MGPKKLTDFLGEFVFFLGSSSQTILGGLKQAAKSVVIFGKDSKSPNFCPSKSMIGVDSCPKFGARESVSFRECKEKLDVLGGQKTALVGNSFDLEKSVERILCVLHRLLHLLLLRTTMTTATG